MKPKKFLTNALASAALSVALVFGAAPAAAYAAELPAVAEGDIVIVYTNDVHCGVVPATDEDGVVTNMGYAGVAGFVDYVEGIAGEENVTLVDIGDAVQGDAIGTMSKGQYLVDIMNEMGYDIMTLGNHEFDYGMEQALALMGQIEGEVISSNFIDLTADAPVFDTYTVVNYGDVDVAFVGITTPESFTKSTPAYFQDDEGNYIYGLSQGNDGADLYAAVQAAVDAASAEADYVIAVGHLGVDELSAPWRSTDVIANTTGIDVFLDGHSHTVMPGDTATNADGEDVLLTQTGTKLANVGCLTLSADGVFTSGLVTGYADVNAEIDAFVTAKMDEFAADLAEIVATTDVALTVNDPATELRMVRSQETNLGDLAADAYRYVLGDGTGTGEPADVAFVNGGGVRADIAAGEISFGQVIAVHPFNNVGTVVEATGQEIIDALEMASRAVPEENGGFLQVSGIEYTVDAGVESTVEVDDMGNFVAVNGGRRVSDVLIGGEPIDLEATYTLASHNYMLLDGGDGINMFTDNNVVVQPVILDNQVLISYIQDYLDGVVGEEYADPYGQGRITVVAAEEAPATEVPAEETPAVETPATEAPAVEAPAVETPATEAPAEETPATETPAVEAPATEAPAPSSVSETALPIAFADVPGSSQYYGYVSVLYENGIVEGANDGLYHADAPMTVAMAITFLYNHAGNPNEGAAVGEWYADAAAWALAGGIIADGTDYNATIDTATFNSYLFAYAEAEGLEIGSEVFDDGAFTRGDAAIIMYGFLEQNE